MSGERETERAIRDGERRTWLRVVIGAAAALVIVTIVVRLVLSRGPSDASPAAPSASGTASATPAASASVARCTELAPGKAFVVGDPPAPRPPPSAPPGDPAVPPDDLDEDDQLAPFAVEVGRSATFDGGFAVGTLREGEGGAVATVAIVDREGAGRLVKLARSRGDMDPPTVAGHGDSVLAAMLEPNAGGRAIRLARVRGETVTWGAELSEGRDESMGLDLAVSGGSALVAWDDLPAGQDHTRVMAASLDPTTLRADATRPVSPPKMDAESPRLVARPGGFWLTWIAHGKALAAPGGKDEDAPEEKRRKGEEDDVDERRGGERVDATWIEVVPLDGSGVATAAPQRATAQDGHVLAYDVAPGRDGALLLAWRDDDTPSGSSGGVVNMVEVTQAGISQPRIVADEGIGTGVPSLLPGWIVVSPVAGPKRIARLDGDGVLLEELASDAALGAGEPLAVIDDRMLVARPAGRAMRLSLLRCTR